MSKGVRADLFRYCILEKYGVLFQNGCGFGIDYFCFYVVFM